MKKILFFRLFASVLLIFSSVIASATNATNQNIVQIASSNPEFSTLVKAIKAAGLVDTLEGKGPFTVFAPTDAAFAKLPKGDLEKLLNNKEELAAILKYHTVSGEVMSKDIKPGDVPTVQGGMIKISVRNGGVYVNNAKVTKADIQASNGVIHVIDTVLTPPSDSSNK